MKGFTVGELGGLALALVVVAVVISVGGEILSELQDEQVGNSTAYNATEQGLEGISTFANWLPLIALVIVAAVVIGIIVRYLGGMGRA